MEIGCPNWPSRQSMPHWDTRISAAYPQALTTALEGLSKQESGKCRSWQMEWNEEGPPDEEKRK